MHLPPGWALSKLPDLVTDTGVFVDGDWVESKDQDASGDVRLIQLADVGDGRYIDKSQRFMTSASAANLGCTFLAEGDVLIARMPDPLGRACIFPGDGKRAVTVVDVAIFRSGSGGIDHQWLVHTLNSTRCREAIGAFASGSTRSRISRGNLAKIELRIPPLNEQRRIVTKLDSLFQQTRAARARLDGLPTLLEKLKRSILAAAFRGDLTADWRAAHPDVEPVSLLLDRARARRDGVLSAESRRDSDGSREPRGANAPPHGSALPTGWTWSCAGDVVEALQAGRSPKAHGRPARDAEQGVLKVSAVSWGRFLPEENKALVAGDVAEPHLLVRRGDLLISRANTVELVGAVVIVDDDYSNLMLSDKTLRIVATEAVTREFLMFALRTLPVRRLFEEDATGTSDSMRNLSQGKIRAAPIPLAPLPEQIEICRRLSRAFAALDGLARRCEVAAERIQTLEQAALAKAFRGELVEQDPDDEPASVLLERIRAARTTEPQQPKRGRARRGNASSEDGKVNGHGANGARDESVDLVVAALQGEQKISAGEIIDATGLDSTAVNDALETLVAAGQVRVHGKARGGAYEWIA